MKISSARGAVLVFISLGVLLAIVVQRGNNLLSLWRYPDRDSSKVMSDKIQHRRITLIDGIRSGNLAMTVKEYQQLDARQIEPEDWFLLGSNLLSTKKPLAMGWAALEAARRLDPNHPATTSRLAELQNRMGTAQGPHRSQLREAARQVEFLGEISGGPTLGTLILGLACFATTEEQAVELLDHLIQRERGTLRAINSPAAAWKLVARLLLETGRATSARDLLEPLLLSDLRGSNSTLQASSLRSAQVSDPEVAWLLSRAALQLEEHDQADAMLELAHGFGRDDTHTPEPSPYVGARKCGDCHRRIYREQQRDSRHALTIFQGPNLKNAPLPSQPLIDPENPGVSHTFARVAPDQIRLETKVEGRIYQAVIKYALGSGRHGITMVGKDEKDTYRELRISYYSKGSIWDRTKGTLPAPHDPAGYIGKELSDRSFRDCIGCHTTRFRMLEGSEKSVIEPEASDHGIGCERCHGPGLHHVKATESGFAESAIAQRAATESTWRLQICAVCHGSDGTIPPQDPEFVRLQGTTLTFSRCFKESQTRLDCTNCHDPHRSLETSSASYEAQCLACHGVLKPAKGGAARFEKTASQLGSSCPVNPATGCIGCHMPKIQNASPHTAFTDHHIRIHREQVIPQTTAH
jgi:Cytochrome c554 and c-prime